MKNLLLAVRTIRNYRFYSVVNIVGLALSLACVITISRYIYSELTTDDFLSRKSQIYFVEVNRGESGPQISSSCPYTCADGKEIDMLADASIISRTNIEPYINAPLKIEKRIWEANVIYCDTTFTQVFDYPTSRGQISQVVGAPYLAAITEQLAQKMFGSEDPIDNTFTIDGDTYTVTAIIAPTKGSLNFDMITSVKGLKEKRYMDLDFLIMAPGTDIEAFNKRYSTPGRAPIWQMNINFAGRPYREIYFDQSVTMESLIVHGNRDSIRVLFIVALAVMIVGLFNFVNIYTVLMLRRSREVGVRKVFGASRRAIMGQLYTENIVMIALALALGWMITVGAADFAGGTLGIPTENNTLFNILLTVAIIVAIPFLTTIHPYFKYKYTRAITSLRDVNQGGRSVLSRAVLLTAQYVITSVLIIVSIYFVRQLDFMLEQPLGYDTKGIIKTQLFSNNFREFETWEQRMLYYETLDKNSQTVKTTLDQSPIITRWYYGSSPNEILQTGGSSLKVGESEFKKVAINFVSEGLKDVYGLKVYQGRFLNDTIDTFKQYKMVVNRTFLREFGITDWENTQVQSETRQWWAMPENEQEREMLNQNPPYSIIGVIEDFQLGHLKNGVMPLALFFSQEYYGETLTVKTDPNNQAAAIEILRKLHEQFGEGDFVYSTVEDEVAAQYAEDRKITNIYSVFAAIAIVIGAMGLFAMSLYDVQQRRREIALRRVNGATVTDIMLMLLRKYYLLLALAFVIAMPIAWLAVEQYVADFAHRAPLSWWIFVVAGAVTATISLTTLIYQIRKAARQNPAEAMKRE